MKIATVVRVNPLRVRLTIPEQFVSVVGVGQPVSFEVDAYPARSSMASCAISPPASSPRSARSHRSVPCRIPRAS